MTDFPIIFSAPMVRALLAGQKTQTRRLAWRATKPTRSFPEGTMRASPWQGVKPGDRVWVRENFAFVGGGDPGEPLYAADWQEDAKARGFESIPAKAPRWTPSIHMPRVVSRLTLSVTATKVEPLQALSRTDALAEGIEGCWHSNRGDGYRGFEGGWDYTPDGAFQKLWCRLHGDAAWGANPDVVALTFEVVKSNIDALPLSQGTET